MTVPSNLIPTRTSQLPEYTGGSNLGYVPYVINGVTYKARLSQFAGLSPDPLDLSDTSKTQGVLPLGRGGTGSSVSPAVGAVVYGDASALSYLTPGDSGQLLTAAGAGAAPAWGMKITYGTAAPSGGTDGDVYLQYV